MKKVLMLMTILSFALKVAWAENTDVSQISNTIYIENFSVKVGEEKTVSVKMKNNFAPTGFQFDIVLPEGISIKTEDDFYCIDLSTARTTSRKTDTFSSARRSDGSVRVICSSTNNYTFSENDGEAATIVFKANSNVTPGNYTLTLKNIELSEANGTAHPLGFDVKSTITVNANTESGKHIIASGECGENATWTLDDEGLLTIGGSGEMADYFSIAPWYDYREVIKEAVIENSVTSIGSHTFSHCPNLISISIPNSVSSISSWAFYDCESLVAVTIPKSVNNIGYAPFTDCPKLVSLIVEDGNANYCSEDNVIFNKDKTQLICCACGKSGDYTIPSSVTDIWDYAFERRKNLSSITISNSVRNIGNYVFWGCEKIERISIPNSVTKIGAAFFANCLNLTSATISASVTSIGIEPFRGCTKLTSLKVEDGNPSFCAQDDVLFNKDKTLLICFAAGKSGDYIIPNTVTAIGIEAFYKCSGLTSITIPNTVKSIGSNAFTECSSITSITIPNGVTEIDGSMFSKCSNLQSITIPESVEGVSFDAFYECNSLTEITNYATKPQRVSNSWLFNPAKCNTKLHVRKGCGEAYGNADYWKNFTIVEDAVNIIASGECGANATWTLDDEGLLTISGTGDMYDYECRKAPWFENFNGNIKNVVVCEGITSIGKHAFDYMEYSMATNMSGCNSLETVSIPRSVTTIGESAFFCCTGLKRIHIPNTTVNFDGKIFGHNHNLTSIEVEEGHPAFCSIDGVVYTNDKTELVRVPGGKQGTYTILDGVTTVSDGACGGCVHLSEINIPSTVTNIGAYAFERCLALTSIEIPNSVTTMLNHAFFYCTALTSAKLPNKMVTLEESVFQYCTSLASIDIPNSVTQFGRYVFLGCSNLKSVVIPNSVENIWSMAFYNCTNLESIVLPESLKILYSSVFGGCAKLTSVTNYSTSPQNIYSSTFSTYGTLHVVKGSGEAYSNANYWKNFTIVEDATYATIIASGECGENATWTLDDEGLLTISGTGAMTDYKSYTNVPWYSYYDSIKKVQIEDGITTIGNSAFRFCSGLANATISSSVTSIGESAFWGCSGLNDITIPSSVTNIGDYAFDDCSGLTNMTIPNSVTNIGVCAFRGCSGLANITISSSVQSISSEVFCGCSGLTSITIPSGVTRIESDAFKDCTGLTNITIPSSVISIGSYAFSNCAGLTKITIPNSVTYIGEKAFYDCSGLTSITIPNSVTSIGSHAFIGCSGLTSIIVDNDNKVYDSRDNCNAIIRTSTNLLVFGCQNTVIPNSVTCIGSSAFTRCSGLASITIPNSVTSIDYYAFLACSGLSSITIPNSVTNIESSAFNECDNLISVTNYSATPQEITSSTFSNYGTLHVVKGAGEAYANADYWKNFTIVEDAVGTEVYENTDISQMTDVLYSAEMKAKSGKQIVLPIYMKNSEAVTLFQTNVYLPQGFTFAKKANGKYAVSLMKDRLTDEDDNHVISSNVQPDGSLLILCSSQDNYTFDGYDGLVATVTIDVADDVAEGPYLIKLNNQKMVRPDNKGSNVAEYQVVLTVKSYTLGDVNDDGDIDGYDLVGISNFILGTNTDGLVHDAADVNSDGDVDGYDYVMEVNTILGTASAAKGKNPTLTENALSALTIPTMTMTMTAGEQTQLTVGMECNGDVFTLVQTDIEFPEGVEPMLRNGRVMAKLAGECLGGADDHSILCVKQGNGKYRILIASQDNTGFTGKNGQLFTIGIEASKDMLPGMYDITMSNTKLVRANSTGVNPSDVTAMMACNEATGINGVEGYNADEQMYNLNGQRVSKHGQRGIYISKGKKNVKLK